MIGVQFDALQQNILDRAKIMASVDAVTARAKSRFGAFVQRRGKNNTRARKKIAKPGQGPSGHTMKIHENIVFMVEPDNVVIGPLLFNFTRSKTTLSALEHGGESLIFERARRGRPARTLPMHVHEHPFMQPAFDAEVEKSPKLWEEAMR
jgi:hypothetical protein